MDRSTLETVFGQREELTDEQKEGMDSICNAAQDLVIAIVNNCPNSADRTTAIRRVREAVLFANESISLNGIV